MKKIILLMFILSVALMTSQASAIMVEESPMFDPPIVALSSISDFSGFWWEYQIDQYFLFPQYYPIHPKKFRGYGKTLDGQQLNRQTCIGPGFLPAGEQEWIVIGHTRDGKVRVIPPPPPPVVKVIPPPPLPPPPPPPKVIVLPPLIVFETVHFGIDNKAVTCDPSTIPALDRNGKLLKDNSDIKVEIAGYTDSAGKEKKNLILSQKRADAVRKYLIDKWGIAPDRMVAKGYGSIRPVADNSTKEGRAKNRRVDTVEITLK